MSKKTFSPQSQDLQPMLLWIQETLLAQSFDHKDQMHIELAVEEALVNIVRHAYLGKSGLIELAITVDDDSIVHIQIRDFGPPFDPLGQAPRINLEAPLEEREVGGLGLYLMRQVMDELLYRRESNSNLLIMKKKVRRH